LGEFAQADQVVNQEVDRAFKDQGGHEIG